MSKRTRSFACNFRLGILPAVLGIALAGCGGGGSSFPSASSPVTKPTTSPATPPVATASSLKPPYLGKIVFESKRGANEVTKLYVMNPDGSQVTPINPLAEFATFNLGYPGTHYMSADGTTFLFTFDQGTGSGTTNYYVKTDGTGERVITNLLDPNATGSGSGATGQVSQISMNATGTRLLFPYANTRGSSTPETLVAINADGTNRTTLYTAPAPVDNFTGGKSFRFLLSSPIFAPDNQTVYFGQKVSNNDMQSLSGIPGYASIPAATSINRVYRLAPGATTPTLIAELPGQSTVYLPGDGALNLSINPDGTKLVFSLDAANSQIYTANTDGTGLTQLTNNTFSNINASFTTDGTKIIFVSDRDGNQEIYSMNPDGSGVTRLTFEIEPDNNAATRGKSSTPQVLQRRIVR